MWVSIQTLLQQHHLSRLCRRTCVLHQVMKPSIAMLLLEATITQGHLRGVGGRGTTQAKMSRQAHQSNRWRTTQKMLRPQHLIMNTWPWRSHPLTPDAAHGSQHKRWPPLYTAPARISSRTHLYGHTYTRRFHGPYQCYPRLPQWQHQGHTHVVPRKLSTRPQSNNHTKKYSHDLPTRFPPNLR